MLSSSDARPDVTLPSAEAKHPRDLERNRISQQTGKHLKHCIQLLNKAVWNVDPREALIKLQTQKKTGRLGFVDRSVIDKAISTLPSLVQGDVRRAYESNVKLIQYQNSGGTKTSATHNLSVTEANQRRRVVIDNRLIALRGTVTLSNGEQYHFMGSDDDEESLLRVGWTKGWVYRCLVSVTNGNFGKLALLLKDLQLHEVSQGRYSICFNIDDGNVITGKYATLLRDRRLDVRVVQLPGELDNKSKREQELERRKSTSFRLKRLQNALSAPIQNKKPKKPLSAWNYFTISRAAGGLKEKLIVLRQAFDRLTSQEKKEYEDKAEADRLRFDTERRSAKPKTPYQIFSAEKSAILLQQYPDKYANREGKTKLTIDLKCEWLRLGQNGWSEYEQKLEKQRSDQNHHDHSLNLLGKAVQDVDAQEALQASRIKFRSWLARVSPSTVASAIASLPSSVQADARLAYERLVKAIKRKHRVVLDERFISIRGIAILNNGERCEFQDYDGTEDTLTRFAWRKRNLFQITFSKGSTNNNTGKLALVTRNLFSTKFSRRYTLCFKIDDDDVILGNHAALLRDRGLELRVVQLPEEPDNKAKRQQELKRRNALSAKSQSRKDI